MYFLVFSIPAERCFLEIDQKGRLEGGEGQMAVSDDGLFVWEGNVRLPWWRGRHAKEEQQQSQ